MAENNVKLTIDDILTKEFAVEFKGYNPIEVDSFLDQVGHDYEAFLNTIAELEEEIQQLRGQLAQMDMPKEVKVEVQPVQETAEVKPVVNSLAQVDILRRLARLEQAVFNNK